MADNPNAFLFPDSMSGQNQPNAVVPSSGNNSALNLNTTVNPNINSSNFNQFSISPVGTVVPSNLATPVSSPFITSSSNVVSDTSGVQGKITQLSGAIDGLATSGVGSLGGGTPGTPVTPPIPAIPPAPVSGYTKDAQGNVYDSTGKYLTLAQTQTLGPNGTPLNLVNLPMGTFTGGAGTGGSGGGSTVGTAYTGTVLGDGKGGYVDQNGNPVVIQNGNAYYPVGFTPGTSGSGTSGTTPPAIPTYNGTLTADDQAAIDAAGNNAGSAFDPLIQQAQTNETQGMGKNIVNAGERGGFLNTQFSGVSAISPTNGGSFVGQGGQLQQQQVAYQNQINQLITQKNNAIAAAKAAQQQLITTGDQKSYDNAMTAYNAAVAANKAVTDAQTAQINNAKTIADTQATLNAPLTAQTKAQSDYYYAQIAKYPDVFANLPAGQSSVLTPNQVNALILTSPTYQAEQQKIHNDAVLQAANISKIYSDIKNAGVTSDQVSNILGTLNDYNGTKYITPTDLTGLTPTQKAAFITAAKAQGIQTITPKDADALASIQAAKDDLAGFQQFTNGVLPQGAFFQPGQAAKVEWNKYLQTNDQLASFNTWKASVIPILSALKGTGTGSGGAGRLFATIGDLLPSSTDTVKTANDKIATINQLLDSGANSIIGTPSTYNGVSLPGSTTDSSGSNFNGITLPN